MYSGQFGCLTSAVSYTPDNLNTLSTPTNNEIHNCIQVDTSNRLQVISAREKSEHNSEHQRVFLSPPPLRSALKKKSSGVKPNIQPEDRCEEVVVEQRVRPNFQKKKRDTHELSPIKVQVLPKHKKKTVAFGRTTNVSQTVEKMSHEKHPTAPSGFKDNLITMSVGENKEKTAKLEVEMQELREKVDVLTAKDVERSEQILVLTEMVKNLLGDSSTKNLKSKSAGEKSHRLSGCISSKIQEKNVSRTLKPEQDVSESDKWAYIKRKYQQCGEFKRFVDQAILNFGNDYSLEYMAKTDQAGDNERSQKYSKKNDKENCSSPVLKTTRVTKKMTVEQFHGRSQSPTLSTAFSYDTKKYLARHGIISDPDHDDQCHSYSTDANEKLMNLGGTANKRHNKSLDSHYQTGGSVTYYSRSDRHFVTSPCQKCQVRVLHQVNADHCRCRDNDDSARRNTQNSLNYQIDDFESENDAIENEVVEISDNSDAEKSHERIDKNSHCFVKGRQEKAHRYNRYCGRRSALDRRLNETTWE